MRTSQNFEELWMCVTIDLNRDVAGKHSAGMTREQAARM